MLCWQGIPVIYHICLDQLQLFYPNFSPPIDVKKWSYTPLGYVIILTLAFAGVNTSK
jgi:hypothetical protein